MGSIESIELDWHEGLYVETEASPPVVIHTAGHGSMRALDVPTGVYFDAKCCLCEWAYSAGKDGAAPPVRQRGEAVGYGYKTPDIEAMLRWCAYHRAGAAHKRAKANFNRMKGQEAAKKNQGTPGVRL